MLQVYVYACFLFLVESLNSRKHFVLLLAGKSCCFCLQSSLICTCVQRGLEGGGEFQWDWLHFATANRRIGRVRMGSVVSEWLCLCKKYLFRTSFHSVFTTESLLAEAAASLGFLEICCRQCRTNDDLFSAFTACYPSWELKLPIAQPCNTLSEYKYCVLHPSPANLDHLTTWSKSDPRLLVQERLFVEFPIKSVVISWKPYNLLWWALKKKKSRTTAFHKFVWVKKGTRWLDHCREAALLPIDSQN